MGHIDFKFPRLKVCLFGEGVRKQTPDLQNNKTKDLACRDRDFVESYDVCVKNQCVDGVTASG